MAKDANTALERRIRPGRRESDSLLADQAERFRLFHIFIDALPEGIISLRLDGTILTWSHGAGQILGYAESDVIGAAVSHLLDFETEWWTLGARHWEGSRKHRDGRPVNLAIDNAPVINHGGTLPLGFIWAVRDVTEQVRETSFLRLQQARLREEARTDPLTGVANRRRFNEVLRT